MPVTPEMFGHRIRHNFTQPALKASLIGVLIYSLKCFQKAIVQNVEDCFPVIRIPPDGIRHRSQIAPVKPFLAGTVTPATTFQQGRKAAFMTVIISMPGYV